MRKYQLFNEHNGKEIYGADLADAILNSRIRKADHWDAAVKKNIRGPEIMVAAIIGVEDTGRSSRGSDEFERVIVETETGERISIDGKYICDIQDTNKRLRQVRDALNKCKNPELIEEIGQLLNI